MATQAGGWMLTGGAALLLFPVSAGAQPQALTPHPSDPLRVQVLTPDCENARGDEIVVCGRRDEPRSRYRLPEEPDRGFDPEGPYESVSRERNGLFDVGASGIGSCSNVGPGGWTGCSANAFRRQIEQHHGEPPGLRNGYRRR